MPTLDKLAAEGVLFQGRQLFLEVDSGVGPVTCNRGRSLGRGRAGAGCLVPASRTCR